MRSLPRPLKLIIEIAIEDVSDVRPQQSKDGLEQKDGAGGGASFGINVDGLRSEEMLSLRVACHFADLFFDGLDAVDGAEGDWNRERGVGGEEVV